MKVVDVRLQIDGLLLQDDESIEDFIKKIPNSSTYDILYEVLYEEKY